MELQRSYIDKGLWGPGPWQDEPDRVEWSDRATRFPCLAIRNRNSGAWCGYVAVLPGHRLHGVSPFDLPHESPLHLLMHGGSNYGALCRPDGEPEQICHERTPGEPDGVWWFGFDCGHYRMDFAPGDRVLWEHLGVEEPMRFGVYRTLQYVRDCCSAAASYLASLG